MAMLCCGRNLMAMLCCGRQLMGFEFGGPLSGTSKDADPVTADGGRNAIESARPRRLLNLDRFEFDFGPTGRMTAAGIGRCRIAAQSGGSDHFGHVSKLVHPHRHKAGDVLVRPLGITTDHRFQKDVLSAVSEDYVVIRHFALCGDAAAGRG